MIYETSGAVINSIVNELNTLSQLEKAIIELSKQRDQDVSTIAGYKQLLDKTVAHKMMFLLGLTQVGKNLFVSTNDKAKELKLSDYEQVTLFNDWVDAVVNSGVTITDTKYFRKQLSESLSDYVKHNK